MPDNLEDILTAGDSILAHYGIKGMRWGQRRAKSSKPQPFIPGQRNYDTRKLSNAELKKVVARMQLETRYRDINKRAIDSGKKETNKLLASIGKATIGLATTAFTAALGKAVKDIVNGNDPFAGAKTIKNRLVKEAKHKVVKKRLKPYLDLPALGP